MKLEFHRLDRRYEGLRRRSPERERKLVASLAEHGQQMPIVVVADASGRSVVVDGYKRVRALVALRHDTVLALRWELAEDAALGLERLMRAGDGDDAPEQAWVLRELRDRFDLSEAELAKRFDKIESWVSRRLVLVERSKSACRRLRRGKRPHEFDAQAEARRGKEKERTPAEVLLGEFGALGAIFSSCVRRARRRARSRSCSTCRASVDGGFDEFCEFWPSRDSSSSMRFRSFAFSSRAAKSSRSSSAARASRGSGPRQA